MRGATTQSGGMYARNDGLDLRVGSAVTNEVIDSTCGVATRSADLDLERVSVITNEVVGSQA